MNSKLNSSQVLDKLRNKERVEVPGFEMDGYFDNKEAYEEALKKADENKVDKSELSSFLEKELGTDTYKEITSGLKSIDYAIKRIEELEGIAYLRDALESGNMEAFSKYKIRAYPRTIKRIKNRETGEFTYTIKTIFRKHIKEAYYLSYKGGMSDNIKDPVHEALVSKAREMILNHPLKVDESEHIYTTFINHPEGDGKIPLEFRITVDLESK